MCQSRNQNKFKKYIHNNENENTTNQNKWDASKAVQWGNCTALNACIIKEKGLKLIM